MEHADTAGLASTAQIDLRRAYLLPSQLRVIRRAPDCVQIGTDPSSGAVLHGAPANCVAVLTTLDGVRPVGDVLARYDADPDLWQELLSQLLRAGLLVDPSLTEDHGTESAHRWGFSGEQDSLVLRHGRVPAARIMQARRDAVVVIRGSAPAGAEIAVALARAGVGHVHHPDSCSPRGRSSAEVDTFTAAQDRHSELREVAERIRRASPTVRMLAPAVHQRPNLVVFAGTTPPDPARSAVLSRDLIPHLAVSADATRAVIGPLVVPGRSSCFSCANRVRADRDPGWPTVARALADSPATAPAAMVAAATALAVGQILDHLDGIPVDTINGTLEWRAGSSAARRRTWPVHPDCGCTRL